MAGTEKIFIKGKLSWVKTNRPNDWGAWTVTVHPDTASLEIIRELQAQGLKNVLKKDDEGYNITFRRPVQRMMKGKVIGLTPPEVIDKDGNTLTGVGIGNGSDGVVKLEVYQHGTPGGGKAKAARFEALKIVNLIPFEQDRDFNEGQKEKVKDLDKQEMLF